LLSVQKIQAQEQQYPRSAGYYFSITHHVGTWNKEGIKYNFNDNYAVIFPIGFNLMKSEIFGFNLELSSAIRSDSTSTKVTSVLFHPGAVFKFKQGFWGPHGWPLRPMDVSILLWCSIK